GANARTSGRRARRPRSAARGGPLPASSGGGLDAGHGGDRNFRAATAEPDRDVNFFSHAVVAARRSEDPRWILGSMLPDFVSMAGLRLESVHGDAPLERGVAFHHTCDDAFHGAPLFVELMERAREQLERDGLDSGPALAIGHVGVELLLDGYLVERHGVVPCYRHAMSEAADVAVLLRFVGLARELGEARWRQLCARLESAPVPQRYTEPAFVADRLIKIL